MPGAAPRDRHVRRILIVRPSALGDVSRTVPALVTLRRAWPEARIDWLVAETFAAAIRHHPMLDEVVTFRRDRLSRIGLKPSATREGLALARRLRDGQYDTVYDLQGLLRSGLIAWLTQAPRRVGFADAREGAWLAYNVRLKVSENLKHTVDRMLGLLEADGLAPTHDMRLYLGDTDRAWLDQFVTQHAIGPSGYACIAPTARWGSKCWPMERYADITRRLLRTELGTPQSSAHGPGHVVVLAAPAERPQVQPLLDMLDGNEQGTNGAKSRVISPQTTVGQMMALVSRTRLLVCNDSAPLHIAVGFNRPMVAIFGPTDPAKVGPYNRDAAVVRAREAQQSAGGESNYRRHRHDPALISKVQVDLVWKAIRQQLAARGV